MSSPATTTTTSSSRSTGPKTRSPRCGRSALDVAAPLVFDTPAATVLVFGPLVGSVLAEHRRFRGDRAARLGDRTYWRLQAWQLAGLVLGALAARYVPGAALPGSGWIWVVVGCAVGLAGAAFRLW